MTDWKQIKEEYLAGGVGYRALAAKHGVGYGTLARYSSLICFQSVTGNLLCVYCTSIILHLFEKREELRRHFFDQYSFFAVLFSMAPSFLLRRGLHTLLRGGVHFFSYGAVTNPLPREGHFFSYGEVTDPLHIMLRKTLRGNDALFS